MNTPLNDALKPCPFCGGAVEESRDCAGFYNYHCTNRKCKCSLYGDYEHHMTGRKAWNTRATTPKSSSAQGAMVDDVCPSCKGTGETVEICLIDGTEIYPNCKTCNATGKVAQPSDATAQPNEEFNGEVLGRVVTYLSQFPEFMPHGEDSAEQAFRNIQECIGRLAAQPRVDLTDERAASLFKEVMQHYSIGAGGTHVFELPAELFERLKQAAKYQDEGVINTMFSKRQKGIIERFRTARALLANTAQGNPSDQQRFEFMAEEECQIEHLTYSGGTRYRLRWPELDEAQSDWHGSPSEAIDAALAAKKG